jgi:tryptophan-rich sensory protein
MDSAAKGGWIRPESETVIAFAILFLLFTTGGYLVWYHRRMFMRGAMAMVLFLVAGINGFGLCFGAQVHDGR